MAGVPGRLTSAIAAKMVFEVCFTMKTRARAHAQCRCTSEHSPKWVSYLPYNAPDQADTRWGYPDTTLMPILTCATPQLHALGAPLRHSIWFNNSLSWHQTQSQATRQSTVTLPSHASLKFDVGMHKRDIEHALCGAYQAHGGRTLHDAPQLHTDPLGSLAAPHHALR